MTDSVPAYSFVYTAAPFGHDGINGFQFVGLPVGGAVPDLIHAVAEHVRYTPPIGVPSQPSAEEIALHFPLSTRIVPRLPNGQALVMQSRYIGQVYQSDGKRGKWGNFFAHARAIPVHAATTVALIGIARTADWRDGLTETELTAAKALDLPEERLTRPPLPNLDELRESDRIAGIAAILARLDGDSPLLFPDTNPERALVLFENLAALLPEVLARRLSWSSFEFDAGPGYDVLATIGDTRLTSDASAYLRLDAPPDNPIYLWAAEAICNQGTEFWTRLSLFSDLSDKQRLSDVLTLIRKIDDATLGALDPVYEALAFLRECPASSLRISGAEAIFERSFSRLNDGEKDNFVLLVSAGKEALALSQWSKSNRPWLAVLEWASAFPSINSALASDGRSEPLSMAIARAISAETPLDHVLDLIFATTENRLSHSMDAAHLSAAIVAVLPDNGHSLNGARTILRLAQHYLKTPAHEKLIVDLLSRASKSAGLDWLDLVGTELPKIAQELAIIILPSLEIAVLESVADKQHNIADAAQRLLRLCANSSMVGFGRRIEQLLSRLDAALPVTGGKQIKASADLIKAANKIGLSPEKTPNALALQATVNRSNLVEVLSSQQLFTHVHRGAASSVYIGFFDAAFAIYEPDSLQGCDKSIRMLWRRDIREHFVNHTVRHFLSGISSARHVDRVNDAVLAHSRTKGSAECEYDWVLICETIAKKLAPRLNQQKFDDLVRDFPQSSLVEAIANQRNRGIAAAARAVGRTMRDMFSRRTGR